MLLDQRHRIRHRCLVRQPVGVVLTPEPGALAFGELAGALAGDPHRICSAQAAADHLQRFAVADGLQQRQIGAVALAQAPGLLHQPIAVELLGALLDPLSQVRGIETQFQYPPKLSVSYAQ